MNPLSQALDDEIFERRLRANTELSPEDKARRLSKLESEACRDRVRAELDFGQRFDVLEYAADIPLIPACGSTLPSALAMHTRK
jgi:hypothetical protein